MERVDNTAMEAASLWKEGRVSESYQVLQKWHREHSEKTSNPTQEDII